MDEWRPYLPDVWGNDEKMTVLFSQFRENRDLNPHSWDAKMKFWMDMVDWEMKYCNQVVIDVKQFPQRFKRKGKIPTCLNKVFNEMLRQGMIQKLSDFEAQANSGWLSWGFGFLVKRPATWAFSALVGSRERDTALEGEYICTELVKEKAKHILDHHHSVAGNKILHDIISFTTLQQQCGDICPNKRTLTLALLQLKINKKIIMIETRSNEKFIKFCSSSEEKVSPLTVNDQNVLSLIQRELSLEKEVETLYADCESCQLEIKEYLKNGQKASAKTGLRRKKNIQSLIEKRESALTNIQSLLLRIKSVHSDKMTFEAYEAGADVLKTTRNDGVTLNKVDTLMAELEELMEDQAVVNSAISEGPSSVDDISLSELERELEDLSILEEEEEEEQAEVPASDISDLLPSVPTAEPSYVNEASLLNIRQSSDGHKKMLIQS